MKNFATILFILISFAGMSQSPEEGEMIFKNNCAVCHTMGGGKLIGPDLAGAVDRREKDWLFQFIRNSGQMIEAGDETAVALYAEYNNMAMPPHDFSDTEMEHLYAFLAETPAPAVAETTTSVQKEATSVETQIVEDQVDTPKWMYFFTTIFVVIVVILLTIVFLLMKMLRSI